MEDVKSRDLPVVLTSDMYFNITQLKQILKSNGFDFNLIKKIYVSCKHNGDKISGVLFQKLLSDFPNIFPKEILHIGDKYYADVETPRSLGINAICYDVIPERLKEVCEYEKLDQSFLQDLSSIRKLAVESSYQPESIEAQIGAGVLGPVLTVFCDWILDICEEEGLTSVFP